MCLFSSIATELIYKLKIKIMKPTDFTCKNCKHWKTQQSELEYSTLYGICTCFHWEFTINDNRDCCLLDRSNLSNIHMNVNRFENQTNEVPFGEVNGSRYCFVTNENFGCVNFKDK